MSPAGFGAAAAPTSGDAAVAAAVVVPEPQTPLRYTGVVPPIRKNGMNADGCCPVGLGGDAKAAAAAAAAQQHKWGVNAGFNEATFDTEAPLAYGGDALYILDIKTLEPLADQDVDGTSDPYLKIWLDGGATCVRTPPRKRTLIPAWTDARDCQRMVFPYTTEEQVSVQAWTGDLVLHVEAWDEDTVFDDFIGYGHVRVSLGAITPFVKFKHWPRAEHFNVTLWDKKGRNAGTLSIRLSHCIQRNYIDAWLHHYHTKTLHFPHTQRTEPIAAASADAVTAVGGGGAADSSQPVPRTSQWWRVPVADQPLILLELLGNVSNRLVRSWLAAPSQVYAGRSMIAALLLVHGALPQEEDDHKEIRAGTLPVPPLLQTPSIAPALEFEVAVKKPSASGAAAGGGGASAAASAALATLAAATTRDAITLAAAAGAAAGTAADAKRPRESSSHFSVFVQAPSDSANPLPVSVPWNAAAAKHAKPTPAAAAVAAAAAAAGLSALAVQAGLRLGNAAAAPLTPLSGVQRAAQQRAADSPLVKRVTALLNLLFRLMSVEHTGNTLRSSDHADVVLHTLQPISAAEIKQNTMCFFAFLTRVTDGGGWESLLDPKRWAGSVVSVSWRLVFDVPAFARVDWEDSQNDPLCQSLLDGVTELIAHTDSAHPLTKPLETKAQIERDAHTDCFGVHELSTQFGDSADSNPWADMVARTRASFEVYDEVFPFRRRPSGSRQPSLATAAGDGKYNAAAFPPSPATPTPKALTKQDSLANVFDFGMVQDIRPVARDSIADASSPAFALSGATRIGGGGTADVTDESPEAPRAAPAYKRSETEAMTLAEIEAALAASNAADTRAAIAADAKRVAPFIPTEQVSTDKAALSPPTTLDNARRAGARLREYSDPTKLFVAGGLERLAIANALDKLFENDRLHIEAHLLRGAGADPAGDVERRAYPLQLERPWFEGELDIARWAVRWAFGQPFVTATYTLDAHAVSGGSAVADSHTPFLLFNHKRWSALNALCNYLVALPPWNLAAVFDSHRLVRHAQLLGSYERVLSGGGTGGAAYPLTPGFDNAAFRARWKLLCWRAGTIARRAAEGHTSKEIVLPPDDDAASPGAAAARSSAAVDDAKSPVQRPTAAVFLSLPTAKSSDGSAPRK